MAQHRNFSSSKIEIFYLVNIGIGIGSVSANMKKRKSVICPISRFKKWHSLVHIGIGRYEKTLIGHTLYSKTSNHLLPANVGALTTHNLTFHFSNKKKDQTCISFSFIHRISFIKNSLVSFVYRWFQPKSRHCLLSFKIYLVRKIGYIHFIRLWSVCVCTSIRTIFLPS